ncbi:MAG TPA: hypothetical protein VFW52_02290 [Candidatus Saccharimonadales bacterium]|nr:hypothetical protein [Candidatus Saccharimonadales bacterium]
MPNFELPDEKPKILNPEFQTTSDDLLAELEQDAADQSDRPLPPRIILGES